MLKIRVPLQQMLLGKLVICLHKTETRSMPITLCSTNSKWPKDLNSRTKTLKLIEEKSREYSGSNKYRQGLPQ
jgi:hypothetical protein